MRWYFDFISPFAYLQSTRLQEFSSQRDIEFRPLLFAGLLKHWGQLGPAELPSKRQWTFKHCVWQAHRDNITLNLPPEHPFNPLPLLRLCIAAGNNATVVERLFRYVWSDGLLPGNEDAFISLCNEFSLSPADINTDEIKNQLLANGEAAIAEGVFGVPSITYDEQLFWGYDATDMALASMAHRQPSCDWPGEKLAAVAALPEGLQRKR